MRERFLDRMWRGALLLGLVALPASLLRIPLTGVQPAMVLHAVVVGVALVVNLRLARLRPGSKAVGLVAVFWVTGLAGLLNFGLLAAALWVLALAVLVAGTAWSMRAGVGHAAAALVAILLAGAAHVLGWLQLPVEATAYMRDPGAWLNLAVVFSLVLMVMLVGLGSYQAALTGLLQELDRQHREIQRLAMLDPLTGLPTLRLARDRIAMARQGAGRSQRQVALLLIDFDRFKHINDSHGHEAGDAVLCEVAARLAALLRPGDTAARIGGDEFLVLLQPPVTGADAAGIAARISQALSRPMPWQDGTLAIGASVVVALFPDHGADERALRRHADDEMYRRKRERAAQPVG